jgi:hypothetical protein
MHKHLAALLLTVTVGCSFPPHGHPGDGGTSPGFPDGASFVPAAHPALPQIVSLGGPLLRTPRVVPVFFGEDPLRADVEAYLRALANSSYWKGTTGEYGVGPLVVDPSIVVSVAAPSVLHEATARDWFKQVVTQSGAAFGTPTENSIYAIYPPSTTVVTVPTEPNVCANGLGGGGFHDSAIINGLSIPFAIAARCSTSAGQTALDVYSATMSHELVETVTDPVYATAAFAQTDDAHAAFQIGTWGEVCDLCEFAPETEFRPPGVPGLSQRCWSNAAAAAGHDPCVPAVSQPYFNAVPVVGDSVSMSWAGYHFQAQGVTIPVGQSKTIEIDLFSDAPTPDWTVKAIDYASTFDGGAPALQLRLDRPSGNNGTKLQLTITVLRADSTYGGEAFVLESIGADGAMRSYWNGIVGN